MRWTGEIRFIDVQPTNLSGQHLPKALRIDSNTLLIKVGLTSYDQAVPNKVAGECMLLYIHARGCTHVCASGGVSISSSFKNVFSTQIYFCDFLRNCFYTGVGVMNYLVYFLHAQAGGSRAETIPFPFFSNYQLQGKLM